MDVLILGGPLFLGRHLTGALLAAGHTVTLFNRGKTNPGLYEGAGVETLIGDRDGDLSALEGRKFDAVIDTCGYVPRIVRASAELLAENVGHYTFISSISVYKHPERTGLAEDAKLDRPDDPTTEVIAEAYGGLKALCEKAVNRAFGAHRALHIRAGLIVRPFDPTYRFTYWPDRMHRGGDVLVPEVDHLCQIIDCRDLAAFIVHCIEENVVGPLNVTGPTEKRSLRDTLKTIHQAINPDGATLLEVEEEILVEEEVGPWQELPLWLPASAMGFADVNIERAKGAGLRCRPLEETAKDTLAWALEVEGGGRRDGVGLDADKEADILVLSQLLPLGAPT